MAPQSSFHDCDWIAAGFKSRSGTATLLDDLLHIFDVLFDFMAGKSKLPSHALSLFRGHEKLFGVAALCTPAALSLRLKLVDGDSLFLVVVPPKSKRRSPSAASGRVFAQHSFEDANLDRVKGDLSTGEGAALGLLHVRS